VAGSTAAEANEACPHVITRSRARLLRVASEEDFTRWVKGMAYRNGWRGVHVRWSQGVLESVHSLRRDGFSEAYGLPDWLFWHEGWGQSFWAELKSWSGRESQDQKRQLPSMRDGGLTVYLWRPQDEEAIERTFRDGLRQTKD
jgi:hypothetical protein